MIRHTIALNGVPQELNVQPRNKSCSSQSWLPTPALRMSEPRNRWKIKLIQGQGVLSINSNNKKRRRPTGENQTVSKRRNSLPDLTNIRGVDESQDTKITEITKTMSNIHVETNAMNMLEEIKKMEE